jgi:ribonuclease P protein component
VQRNRIKRRLRAAVATARIEPGFDYVLIPTAEVAEVPFGRLVEWVTAGGGPER